MLEGEKRPLITRRTQQSELEAVQWPLCPRLTVIPWSRGGQQHGLPQTDTAFALEELDPEEETKGNHMGWVEVGCEEGERRRGPKLVAL